MSYASDALIDAQEREIKKLKAENAKLRELLAISIRCHNFLCSGCSLNEHGLCAYEERAAELGIEVE